MAADFKSATYAELAHSYEVGTFVEGDPFRPYLILQSGFGNGLVPDFETLVHIYNTALQVLGGLVAAAKAYGILKRIRDRISRGRDVTTARMEDWRSRGGSPAALAAFCSRRPSTSDELAQFLGCTVEEAESVLWAWGFAPDEDGRWVPEPNAEAAMLRRTWEIGMFMFDDPEFRRRLSVLAERYVETGHVPELEEALGEPPHEGGVR